MKKTHSGNTALLIKSIPLYTLVFFILVVIGMNVLAKYQLISLPYLALNAGIFISWAAFLILDIITKYFGAKAANILSMIAIIANLLVGGIFFLLSKVLNNANIDIFVFSNWSIMLASTIAFIISAITNNYANVFVGKKLGLYSNSKKVFIIRSYVSTLVGQIVDNFIFVFLAFFLFPNIPGALPVKWTIYQCIGASIFGAIIELLTEVITTPLGYKLLMHWHKINVGKEYFEKLEKDIELDLLSAYEIGKLVNERKISAAHVLEHFINNIEQKDKDLHAFTYLKLEEARLEAKKIDERLARGEHVGPFAGVPFALKDFLDSKKGWTNSRGGVKSLISVDNEDSPFTKAMESLGGVAIGKTNAPTYGFRGTCDNLLYGATNNPFNHEYNSGGSSGGSAAAVASLMVPISEGGDAGGSIRIPASWCNCFGYKASLGTVPDIHQGSYGPTHPFCMGGGITKSVVDSAILLNAMKSYDPLDPYSVKVDTNFFNIIKKPIKGMKIVYTDDFGLYPVEDEIKKISYEKAMSLTSLGAIVERVNFSFRHGLSSFVEMWLEGISTDSAKQLGNKLDTLSKELPREFIYWNKKALKMSDEEVALYQALKKEIEDNFARVFKEYDIIISPVTICPPVKNSDDGNTLGPERVKGVKIDRLISFCETFLINYVGYPACSIPAGLNEEGLPIGIQMIGDLHQDEKVLRLANNYEKINPWKHLYIK